MASRLKGQVERARAARYGQPQARFGRGCRVVLDGDATLGDKARIGLGSHLVVMPGAHFSIGPAAHVGDHSIVLAADRVVIGAGTLISWRCQLMNTDFHEISGPDGPAPSVTAPVHVGEHVLVGTGSIVLKGVTIGDGAVVGAGSVVTRDVQAGWLVAGNPARPIRRIGAWK